MSGATPALAGAAVRDARARLLARIDGTVDLIRPAFPHAADGDTGLWRGDYFLLEALTRWPASDR